MSVHAVLWLDHNEARVFHVDPGALSSERFKTNNHDHHIKHGGRGEHGRTGEDAGFWKSVAASLHPAREILVVGPGDAKAGFMKWVGKHDHAVADRVVSVETVDHPTDNQLVAYAKKYFRVREKAAHG